jgi:hypothetical protein
MDDLALRSDGVATEQMCDEVVALIRTLRRTGGGTMLDARSKADLPVSASA